MIGFGQCTFTSTDESSLGACDGSISVTITGCPSPYTYSWSNGQATPTATGLCSGTYTLILTDANNNICCTETVTINVTAGIAGCTDSLALNYDPTATIDDSSCVYCNLTAIVLFTTDVTCNGLCDGTATITPAGGCAPYTYLWDNGQVTSTAIGLCAGTYTCTVTDCNGCVVNNTFMITEPLPLISYDTLSVTTSIVWNGMTLTVSGDYSVTLTNSVGCDSIANLNLTITIPSGILNVTNTEKTLLKITDMLGQETPYRRNTPLFYIYDDGTVEKRIVIE